MKKNNKDCFRVFMDNYILEKLDEYKIKNFYYFSLVDNIESIIKNGILSKNIIKYNNIKYCSFSNEEVQKRREQKFIYINNKKLNLHDFVPVYLVPKTPTLYVRKNLQDKIFFAVINSNIIAASNIDFVFTDGNAACYKTRFYKLLRDLNKIEWEVIWNDSWTCFEDGKRKRNAEFLIYPQIYVNYIKKIVVNNPNNFSYIQNILNKYNENIQLEIDIYNNYFF
jgi:hypothetical protein